MILCTASRRVPGGEDSEHGYIQGAADDSESWAHGLTPGLFWQHKAALAATAEDDLPDLITSLVSQTRERGGQARSTPVAPTRQIFLGSEDAARDDDDGFAVRISCTPAAAAPPPSPLAQEHVQKINLACARGKVGSRQLRHSLSAILPVLDSLFPSSPPPHNDNDGTAQSAPPRPRPPKILVTCATGKDHSVGVALAILCLYVDDAGALVPRGEGTGRNARRAMDKSYIKQRLSWIMVAVPDANPSRTTLQSVNAFLLG